MSQKLFFHMATDTVPRPGGLDIKSRDEIKIEGRSIISPVHNEIPQMSLHKVYLWKRDAVLIRINNTCSPRSPYEAPWTGSLFEREIILCLNRPYWGKTAGESILGDFLCQCKDISVSEHDKEHHRQNLEPNLALSIISQSSRFTTTKKTG